MWDKIIEYMAANGVWALLFLGLLVYQLQDSKKREEKYTATITSLTEGLNALEGIKQDIKNIIDTLDSTVAVAQGLFTKKKPAAAKTRSEDDAEPDPPKTAE
ncbi:MAG: hypothetical protein J6Y74_04070 [Clostridia bacterium]|nr:hypothetical protein [Clostridia bacterium]